MKDLFDYESVKKCRVCKNISSKSKFYKSKTKRDGLNSECISCCKEYYMNNSVKLIQKQKDYYLENQDRINNNRKIYNKENRVKINFYEKNRRASVLNFKLACNLRSRTNKAFKSQNVRKTNKTFDLFGCSHLFFQRWIIHQLYGKMTIEKYGSVWQIDHCLPIASFNLLNEIDMKKCFKWINHRPMFTNENNLEKAKIDHYLYLLQEVKEDQFIKVNEEGLN